MPDETSKKAIAASAARTVAVARLDLIAINLKSSAAQIALASVAMMLVFSENVVGLGHGLTAVHYAWLGLQLTIAATFFAVARFWPAGEANGLWGVPRRDAYAVLYAASGAAWGALTWVAMVPDDLFNQVFIMLVMVGVSVFYVVRLSACTQVFFAGALGLFAVALSNSWISGSGLSRLMHIAAPIWITLLAVAAWRLGAQISDMIETRLREGELVRRLSEANARVEAESASKSAFLANMSHELRTPLNAILGFSDLMREGVFGKLDPRYHSYMEDIHASGEHLLSLINDLLDISKIESGRMQLAIEPVDVAEIAPQVTRLLQPKVDAKRQTLTVSLADAPAVVMADSRALLQIMLNLAGNAVKYTQLGGAIRIALVAEGRDVVITVADDGPGIPADKLSRLFRPFERVDNSYLAGESGTGLGLALVSELAALHGGAASIESAVGVGTTVTVRLPDAVVTSARAAA